MHKLLLLHIVLLCAGSLSAQDFGNSPYSSFGLGDPAALPSVRSAGMAGIGISAPSAGHINTLNPALLTYNTQVAFEFGVGAQIKQISNNNLTQTDGNTTLRYLAFAFPVHKRYTTGIGLRPYSSVSYKIITENNLPDDTVNKARYLFQGYGGINEVYWSHGVRLAEGLSAGLEGSYLFGNLTNESVVQVLDRYNNNPVGNLVAVRDRKTIHDIGLKGGLHYRRKLTDKITMGASATYQYFFPLSANQFRSFVTSANTVDTLDQNFKSEQRSLQLPAPVGLGLNLANSNRWSVSVEGRLQNWATFTGLAESVGTLGKGYQVALGGEYTPDPASVTSYIKRITLRGGVSLGQSPIILKGQHLPEKQVSLGLGLPTGRNGSSVNMAFVAGLRGTTKQELVKEKYFRFDLGFTFNDKWFQRPQFD